MTALETQLYNALHALWDGKTYGKWSEEFEIRVETALNNYLTARPEKEK